VFTIGQLDAALLQSACAFLQGFGYLAIRIRTVNRHEYCRHS
jgi:hypothetical protein